MKEQRITIAIDGNGAIHADAEGFSGDACVKDLERLLEGLATDGAPIERKADHAGAGALRSVVAPAIVGRKS